MGVKRRLTARLRDSLRWTGESPDLPAVLAAALGMGVPILAGALAGRLQLGLGAALGGLLARGAATGRSIRGQTAALAQLFAAVLSASAAAAAIAGHGRWTDAAIVALAGVAGAIGGYSYVLAVASGRFVLFLVISLSTMENGGDRLAMLAVLLSGTLWTLLLGLGLGALFRAAGWRGGAEQARGTAASAVQKWRRWTASLRTLAGWQYPLRLVPCLAVAGILRALWPDRHLLWIAVTVAILCQRQLEPFPARTVQRSIGAAVGVAATGLLLGRVLPGWGLALLVAALASLGVWLRAQNYLAYTAGMTLLVILLLSAGAPIEAGTLVDRLAATLAGAGLVIAANAAVARICAARDRAAP
jgi:hypothetical protein